MKTYLLRRLLQAIPTLLLVTMVTFTITMLLPGDPALAFLGEAAAMDKVAYEAMRRDLGLDQPLPVQYVRWLGRMAQGDLGRSVRTKEPVWEAMQARFPVTLQLTAMAMIVALLMSVPVGIISAVRPNSKLDMVGTVVAISGLAIPAFWLGIMLIFVFALWLHWLPPSGYAPPSAGLGQSLQLMLLPALALGAEQAAVIMRQVRSALLEVLHQEYITTAWSKGLPERRIVVRHAVRNALIPIVTIIGLQIGRLFGGAVVIETVFALPGLGRLAADSIFFRDFPSLQAVVLILALAVFVSNLLTDAVYAWVDPRIRYA
ncbi:MAG: ABC transporter permease [Chloroflexi bacterium]|nr:ABC transporter permease [Chloroflexota bacterium]